MLTHTNAGLDRRTIRSRIRPFAANPKNHPGLQPEARLFEVSEHYQPIYVTFERIKQRTYTTARRKLEKLIPGETYAYYYEALHVAYVEIWTRLAENPQLFAHKPFAYIMTYAAYRACDYIGYHDRRSRLDDSYEAMMEPEYKNRKGDALEYANPFRNQRRPGDPHAGFEYFVDAHIDFEAIKAKLLAFFETQPTPQADVEMAWYALKAGIGHCEMAQITRISASHWNYLRKRIVDFLTDNGLLDDWTPANLQAEIEKNPQPLQELATAYADADDLRSLIVLYYIACPTVAQKDLRWPELFTGADKKEFYRHKLPVLRSLMQRYRIYNPEY